MLDIEKFESLSEYMDWLIEQAILNDEPLTNV